MAMQKAARYAFGRFACAKMAAGLPFPPNGAEDFKVRLEIAERF